MSLQVVTESAEKTKQQPGERRESLPDSRQSFPGRLHPIVQLQRRLGNRRVAQLMRAGLLTPDGSAGNTAVVAMLARARGSAGVAAGPRALAAPAGAGVDWDSVWAFVDEYGLDILRTGFEVGRLVPAIGLWSGLAADSIGWWGEFRSQLDISVEGDDNWLFLATTIRNILNIVNNGVGAILYVDQVIQDGAAATIVGAELVPLTLALNEIGSGGKVVLDFGLTMLDAGIGAWARADALSARNPKDAEIFKSLWTSYAANFLGDVFTIVVDSLGFLSGGASQSGAVGQATQTVEGIAHVGIRMSDVILSLIGSMWNVWGGRATGPTASSAGTGGTMARSPVDGANGRASAGDPTAADIAELEAVGRCVSRGDEIMGTVSAFLGERMADAQQVADVIAGGGQAAFMTLRDSMVRALDEARTRIDGLREAEALTRTASENSEQFQTAIESLIGMVDALTMPDITIPTDVDIGDNPVADAVEGVAGAVAGAADTGLQAALDSIRNAMESAKAEVRQPLQDLLVKSAEVGEFLALVTEGLRMQLADAEQFMAEAASSIAGVDSLPEMLEALLGEALELAGLPEGTTFGDVVATWASVGPQVAEALDYARSRVSAAAAPPPE
jgi:hypothetical protein